MKFLVRSNLKEPVYALTDVSFAVGAGEICAVLGPNGAGKTTTFRILMGLTTPDTGHASVLNRDVSADSLEVRRLVGWMPAEDRSLLMRLSCRDNLVFHAQLQGLPSVGLDKKILETLDRVGIARAVDNSVFSMSAGMRARLQLARALLHEPRVLILDEPTGSVDPVAAHELLNLVMEIVDESGIAALISSHRLEEIEALHSHAILLDEGKVLFDGDLDDLRFSLHQTELEIEFSDPTPTQQAAELLAALDIGKMGSSQDNVVKFYPHTGISTGQVLAALDPIVAQVIHVREVEMPLRDVFASMYNDARTDQ